MTTDAFSAAERGHLTRVAYRVLGSWHDAEDVVSEAWLRWQRAPQDVRDPRAWLTRVVGRLALDELRSARARRESYVGPWLPEPDVTAEPDPADVVVTDESLRLAFLLVLEALTPEQRVAFVLHDVLDVPFEDVAQVLDCSVVAARQHASRARRHVRSAAPPPQPPAAQVRAAIDALAHALGTGDVPALSRLLREDVSLVADGGGQVAAAGRPLQGGEVARFLFGVVERHGVGASVEAVLVNGEPGFLVHVPPAGPRIASLAVYTVAVAEGRIAAIHVVLAPDKLSRVPGGRRRCGRPRRHRSPARTVRAQR